MTPTLEYYRLPNHSTSGFTLLEMLLVLTIIGMASILVVPNLGSLDSRTFATQVRQATSLLNYARRIAVVSGQPSTAIFHITTDESNDGAPDRGDREATQSSSYSSSVGSWESTGTTVRYRDSTDREIEVEEQIEITFYPEGGSTGGTLVFSQEERLVNIDINPFTGRIDTTYPDEN